MYGINIYLFYPQEDSGCWRGDPGRQITVFDTPGLCAEDTPDSDINTLRGVVNLVKDLRDIRDNGDLNLQN